MTIKELTTITHVILAISMFHLISYSLGCLGHIYLIFNFKIIWYDAFNFSRLCCTINCIVWLTIQTNQPPHMPPHVLYHCHLDSNPCNVWTMQRDKIRNFDMQEDFKGDNRTISQPPFVNQGKTSLKNVHILFSSDSPFQARTLKSKEDSCHSRNLTISKFVNQSQHCG